MDPKEREQLYQLLAEINNTLMNNQAERGGVSIESIMAEDPSLYGDIPQSSVPGWYTQLLQDAQKSALDEQQTSTPQYSEYGFGGRPKYMIPRFGK